MLLLTAAFLLRLTAAFWWEQRLPAQERFGFADSHSYWLLAQTIVRGEPYQFGGADLRIFRTPGYPLLLAGLMAMVGDDPPVIWARALSALLGVAAVGGVACLAGQLFGERAAWLAALLATVYPGAVAMSVMVLSEAPFAPCLLAQLNGWVLALRSPSRAAQAAAAGLAGVSGGAATLMRPSWLLFTPLAVGLALLMGPDRRRHAWLGTWLLLGLVVVMTPWWVRNYRLTGRFVPTTLQVGASLYDGWNPLADGGSDMRFVEAFYHRQKAWDAEYPGELEGTFEERLDRRMRDAALGWAAEHPGRVLELAGIKFLRMWNIWPNAAELRSARLRLVVLLGYVPLLAAGLWGLWKFRARGWPIVLCWLPAAYLTLLHMVFVSSIRYRQPAMLPVCALAAGVLSTWWFRRRAAP
jgi:4-amino-4-deoxy-L-arabinose transferase-like glycosyltransferase